jgi:hypothetical protein
MSKPFTSEDAIDYPAADVVTEIKDKADVANAGDARFDSGARASSTFWAVNDRVGRGLNWFNKGWPNVTINRLSQIAVSICELDANGNPKIGAADMQILNVVPANDSTVWVRYNVAFATALPIRFNFIVVN